MFILAKPEIEQHVNQEEWEKNTLQEVEEQISSQTTLETSKLKEKELKRPR